MAENPSNSHEELGIYNAHNSNRPCRTCTDFKSWVKFQQQSTSGSRTESSQPASQSLSNLSKESQSLPHDCPLDITELGRSTWGLLHTMAANYPEKPTAQQKEHTKQFFNAFSKTYPCEMCAHDFDRRMKKSPIQLDNQTDFSQWLCRIHNDINKMLGKPSFDCSRVNERWRDGWNDGSCD